MFCTEEKSKGRAIIYLIVWKCHVIRDFVYLARLISYPILSYPSTHINQSHHLPLLPLLSSPITQSFTPLTSPLPQIILTLLSGYRRITLLSTHPRYS